ncbi:MAG: Gldg family protein [Planctomycetes bacterium]|nr:Gldg family protein [Planctomycetota bacterium]
MNTNVVLAIFRRNFVSYFSSPIGYVFICAFVLLSAFAAFWPNDFFAANLANLQQLNNRLPWIMLVFIPAVTMAIWTQERERGTDELLLTLPAKDLEIVIGKYLAALFIFTVSLIFSLSNIGILMGLGDPDLGLLVANYIGYWFVGAAMLSVGMVASFLTRNLTVSFILAMAFNAPLVFASYADVIHGRELASVIKSLGVAEQFSEMGRGVISLSSVIFFVSLIGVMLYLSMVLIRKRHWANRNAGMPMALHYAVRVIALAVMAIGVNVFASRIDIRFDVTSEQLSSLSPNTRDLIDQINPDQPVYIEAYISLEVPERFVQTQLTLISLLNEIDAMAGDDVIVRINYTELYSQEAQEALEQFGISPRTVPVMSAGRASQEVIFLGAAFMSGLDRVIVPFFEPGVRVEYETVRSIATVSQQTRKRIGVLVTDAQLYGGFDMQSMSSRPDQQIITELNKQYETVRIDAIKPIPDDIDVLFAVQPSTLPQQQMNNFIDAVAKGIPTAIFEDPFPRADAKVAATSQRRVPPGGNNPFQQRPAPEPKGDIKPLWDMLQIDFFARQIIKDDFNPHPSFPKPRALPPEFVFIGYGSGTDEPFSNQSAITSGLQEMMFLFTCPMRHRADATTNFTPLLTTGNQTGLVNFDDMQLRSFFGPGGLNPNRRVQLTKESYTIAAHIRGPVVSSSPGDSETNQLALTEFNVVVTSDIDLLYSVFFNLRAQGDASNQVSLSLDNITYVLNVLDELAGDDRFIDIRKRRRVHRALTAVESKTEQARDDASEKREQFQAEYEEKRNEESQRLDAQIQELQNREGIDVQQMALEVQAMIQNREKRLSATTERLQRAREKAIDGIERDLAIHIRDVQRGYKIFAVTIPPIPPLAVGVVVYLRRRKIEHIGSPKQRLKSS